MQRCLPNVHWLFICLAGHLSLFQSSFQDLTLRLHFSRTCISSHFLVEVVGVYDHAMQVTSPSDFILYRYHYRDISFSRVYMFGHISILIYTSVRLMFCVYVI